MEELRVVVHRYNILHQTELCQSLSEALPRSPDSSQRGSLDHSVSRQPCNGEPPRLP